MSTGRVVPYARPQSVKCSVCSSSDAVVACLPCAAYQCGRCEVAAHKAGDARAHVRFPVAQMKSFIDFSAAKAGESAPRSHRGSPGVPLALTFDGCDTPYATFWRSVKLYGSTACLGARSLGADGQAGPYVFETYAEIGKRVLNLAAALRSYGVEPKARVGLYSVNRPEWVIGEQACYANNLVTVPLYDTLGPEAAEQIIGQATLSAVICSADKVPSLIEIAAKTASLRLIIVMPAQAFETKLPAVREARVPLADGLRIVQLKDAEVFGSGLVSTFEPLVPAPSDICTFCYTSGTTGAPKGAMITHANQMSDMTGVAAHSENAIVQEGDYHISYLPLAHTFERLIVSCIISVGGTTGFSRGNPLLLLEDIELLRPTTFGGVPRLYNRLYDKVTAMISSSSPVKRWLFNTAYNAKLANLRATGSVTHPVWDRLVFSKIAAKLGGRVRVMVTGSAPIADNVMQFLRICFSCSVVEGYGQTESSAASTITVPGDDRSFGNVGLPLICNLVKLVDVPEMNYTSKDVVNGAPCPRGEVCFKGANIFAGYYQDPEKTAEALDADGWLHSGDIGMWLPDQSLKLIDRKKNIFKTAQGEYIAPERLENTYQRSKYVGQSYVHGDSLESSLVAVVVPDEEELGAWAKANGIKYGNFAELVANPAVMPLILADMNSVAKAAQLKGFEQVKRIFLTAEPFSVENDLLTPTMKLKRAAAAKKFANEIAVMYGKGAAAPIKSKL